MSAIPLPDYPQQMAQVPHLVDDIKRAADASNEILAQAEGMLEDGKSYTEVMQFAFPVSDRLQAVTGLLSTLASVASTDVIQDAKAEATPFAAKANAKASASPQFAQAAQSLVDAPAGHSPEYVRLAQLQAINGRMTGALLPAEEREAVTALRTEMASTSAKFSKNLLAGQAAWHKELTADQVQDLPRFLRSQLVGAAKNAGNDAANMESGPWRLTLDPAVYMSFLAWCTDRELRRELAQARACAASDMDKGTGDAAARDNTDVVKQLLRDRAKLASMVGKANYAEVSTATKMAQTPGAVMDLLNKLLELVRSKTAAELDQFADVLGLSSGKDVRSWDVPLAQRLLKERDFGLDDELVSQYFPLPHVLSVLKEMLREMFGLSLVRLPAGEHAEAEPGQEVIPTWHPSVEVYHVTDAESAEPLAVLYIDPFSRPGAKRGGAWVSPTVSRAPMGMIPEDEQATWPKRVHDYVVHKGVRLPVTHLVLNAAAPSGMPGDEVALLRHDDLTTLCHELGHALQASATVVQLPWLAGIEGIEWDAVEVPSQAVEQLSWHAPSIKRFSKHVETGEPMPEDMAQKLATSRTLGAAYQLQRQLVFGLMDMALHTAESVDDVYALADKVMKEVSPVTPGEWDARMLCTFGHLFGGGYAAGYYSYLWAEMLSADAYEAWLEAGLGDPARLEESGKVGRKFRDTILALGGSQPPADVFRAFRGRDVDPGALIRVNLGSE